MCSIKQCHIYVDCNILERREEGKGREGEGKGEVVCFRRKMYMEREREREREERRERERERERKSEGGGREGEIVGRERLSWKKRGSTGEIEKERI